MKRLKTLILLLFSVSLMLFFGCSGNSTSSSMDDGKNDMDNMDDTNEPTSREVAPDFTYTSLDGTEHTLSDYEGKVVYIFFFGANCPHCRSNGPVTQSEIYQRFWTNTNFVALGLDTWNTSASEVDAFKNVTGITYPLLLNAQQSLLDYYGDTSSHDRSVVIDPEGKIAYKGTGFVDTDTEKVIDVIKKELAEI